MIKILRLIEILVLALFFGFPPVLLCVVAAGFVNVIFLEEKGIAYWALGGAVLVLLQYWLTSISAKVAFRLWALLCEMWR